VTGRDERRTLELGGGFVIRYTPLVSLTEAPNRAGFDVELVLGDDGTRLVVDELTLIRREGGRAITSEGLKYVPVNEIITFVALGWDADDETTGADGVMRRVGRRYRPVDQSTLDALPELERVAFEYRFALAIGAAPTQAVADALDVTPAVAAKRVQKARRAGLLAATTPGKRGV
jgi:hypothetical protein